MHWQLRQRRRSKWYLVPARLCGSEQLVPPNFSDPSSKAEAPSWSRASGRRLVSASAGGENIRGISGKCAYASVCRSK